MRILKMSSDARVKVRIGVMSRVRVGVKGGL